MATPFNNYNEYSNDYGRGPRSHEEYEYMRHKQMMYEQQAMQNIAIGPGPEPEKPKKPKHLNQKLLLTKG